MRRRQQRACCLQPQDSPPEVFLVAPSPRALQEQVPDAKVLYSSATGASEPKNLGGWAGWLAGWVGPAVGTASDEGAHTMRL